MATVEPCVVSRRWTTSRRWSTRALDLAFVGLSAPVWLPVLMTVACAVVVSSGRPIFFRQERVGLAGSNFSMLKFRSMTTGDNPLVPDPSCITPIGRLLRRTSLDELRSIGVRIALDDFGTGYSSLSLLQDFPVQRIKIDRAFVDTIAEPDSDNTLVRTIIGLGESMGVDIVAEGVETVLQLRALRELGCAKAQGFLISHPVPAEAMRSTVGALDGLAQWPEFNQLMGDSSLERSPGHDL